MQMPDSTRRYLPYMRPAQGDIMLFSPLDQELWHYHVGSRMPLFGSTFISAGDEVFYFGGELDRHLKSEAVFAARLEDQLMVPEKVGSLNLARSSFGACQIGEVVYLMGGYIAGGEVTAYCESYDMSARKGSWLASMKFPAAGCTVCPFNHKWIYKMGGKSQAGMVGAIEQYDIATDTWATINPLLIDGLYRDALLAYSCGAQINPY
jgi:hypothetical protein